MWRAGNLGEDCTVWYEPDSPNDNDPTPPDDNGGGGGGGGDTGGGSSSIAANRVTSLPNTPQCLTNIATALLTLANYNAIIDQLAQQDAGQSYNPYYDVNGILHGLAIRDDWNIQITAADLPDETDSNGNTYKPNAVTHAENGHIVIRVDNAYLAGASQLSVARTVIHEYLHAYFEYGLADASGTNYSEFQLMNNYLYDKKGRPDDTEDNQHEEIAQRYSTELGNSLEQYAQDNGITSPDPTLSLHDYCQDMAWGGLKGTSAYSKYAKNKSRIERELQNEQTHNNHSSTAKACP